MTSPHVRAAAPQTGFSTPSLVFGILSFCVPPLGLVAVICGHLGLSKIRKSNGTLEGRGLCVAGLVMGYIGLAFCVFFLVLLAFGRSASLAADKEAEELFPVSEVALPEFPQPGAPRAIENSNVSYFSVQTSGEGPGQSMTLRVYLPPGEHTDGSLACVMVPPAGSNFLSGMALDGEDYHDETLPYAEAGMVVVFYSIDGPEEVVPEDAEEGATSDAAQRSYEAFRDAHAGVVNGRNALEFVLQRLLAVNPEQIFSAGHSSAGTLSLLLASHEPRLAGAIAYAPGIDTQKIQGELLENSFATMVYPDLKRFLKQSSPITHVSKIDVPVFLFFAKDDTLVSLDRGNEFRFALSDRNLDATLRTVDSGGHYQSMINRGIPYGIEWIQERTSRK